MVQIKSYKFEFDFNNAKIQLQEKIPQLIDIAAKSTSEQVLSSLENKFNFYLENE